MKFRGVFILFFAGLSLCGGTAVSLKSANEVEINSVLASVSGHPITLGDVLFETWDAESRIYALAEREEIPELIAGVRMDKLEELINRRLLINEFDRLGHSVAPEYIEEALNMISRELGCLTRDELEARAKDFHTDYAELRRIAEERIKMEMLVNGLVMKRANVTPRQVAGYIDEHRDEFVEEAKIRFSILKLDSSRDDLPEAAKAVADALANDSSAGNFIKLAGQYSDWKRELGGDVGLIDRNRLRRDFAGLLGEDPAAGVVYGPLDFPDDGFYYLFVTELQDAFEPDWKEVRKKAAEKLEAGEKNRIMADYLQVLRAKAVIERK